jgi:hypothetical protein
VFLWLIIGFPLLASAGVTTSVPITNTTAVNSANIPMVLFIREYRNSLIHKYTFASEIL